MESGDSGVYYERFSPDTLLMLLMINIEFDDLTNVIKRWTVTSQSLFPQKTDVCNFCGIKQLNLESVSKFLEQNNDQLTRL